jgi:hypothetical protein
VSQHGITGGWLHCNIQVVCQPPIFKRMIEINTLGEALRTAKSDFRRISSSQPKN